MNFTCSTTRWNWKCYDDITLKSFISRCQLKLNGQRWHKIPLIYSICVHQNLNCCMCEKMQWYSAISASLFCVWTDHAANTSVCAVCSCLIKIQRDTANISTHRECLQFNWLVWGLLSFSPCSELSSHPTDVWYAHLTGLEVRRWIKYSLNYMWMWKLFWKHCACHKQHRWL